MTRSAGRSEVTTGFGYAGPRKTVPSGTAWTTAPQGGEAPPRPGCGVDAGDEADRLEGDAGGHGDAECGDPGRGGRVEENAVGRHAAGDDVVYYGGPVGEESEASARIRALAAGYVGSATTTSTIDKTGRPSAELL